MLRCSYARLAVLLIGCGAYLKVNKIDFIPFKGTQMAYQNLATPSEVLINEITATRDFFTKVGNVFSKIGEVLAGIGDSMAKASGRHSRFERVRFLEAKSDDELAALNIKREDIVHTVFKDIYFV